MKIYNVLEVKSYGCSGDHASVYSKVFKTEAAAKKCLKERAAELDYSILEKIDTYETSILPFEDCCTIFVAKHPETKPKRSIIEKIETKIENLDELIDKAVEGTEIIEL